MELLLVKHAKTNGRISELMFNLNAGQNEVADLEHEDVRLCGDLQMHLGELQCLTPIHDVEAEAKRLRIEARGATGGSDAR